MNAEKSVLLGLDLDDTDDDWSEWDLDEFSEDEVNLCFDDICRNAGRCVWNCWKK